MVCVWLTKRFKVIQWASECNPTPRKEVRGDSILGRHLGRRRISGIAVGNLFCLLRDLGNPLARHPVCFGCLRVVQGRLASPATAGVSPQLPRKGGHLVPQQRPSTSPARTRAGLSLFLYFRASYFDIVSDFDIRVSILHLSTPPPRFYDIVVSLQGNCSSVHIRICLTRRPTTEGTYESDLQCAGELLRQ